LVGKDPPEKEEVKDAKIQAEAHSHLTEEAKKKSMGLMDAYKKLKGMYDWVMSDENKWARDIIIDMLKSGDKPSPEIISKEFSNDAPLAENIKITRRQLKRIVKETWENKRWNRTGKNWKTDLENWSDIQKNHPEFYVKAEEAFQGYNGKFEGLSLQDFIRSIDPVWLASQPLTSSTWRMFYPEDKERAQLEAVLLSIVRPEAAQNIPDIEELRNIYKVR